MANNHLFLKRQTLTTTTTVTIILISSIWWELFFDRIITKSITMSVGDTIITAENARACQSI